MENHGMTRLRGIATEVIPFGAHVLCRGFKVSLATPEIANGIAASAPPSAYESDAYPEGAFVSVEAIEGLGARDLHAMANAPLMDPNQLFLPAGKLSMQDYRRRVAADVKAISDEGARDGQ
jgi:hypothetical protein